MKTIFLLLFASIAHLSYSQDIVFDKKTNDITVDGAYVFDVVRAKVNNVYYFEILDAQGNKLIHVNYRDYNDVSETSSANPKGTVRYFEFVFLDSKQKAEFDYPGLKQKWLAKIIVANKLIVDGKLDQKAVDEFVLINGTQFSDRMKRGRN